MIISNETSYLEAIDYDWDHADDWMWHVQNRDRTLWQAVAKRVSDCLVFAFAWLLGAQDEKKLSEKFALKNHHEYESTVQKRMCYQGTNQPVILVLQGDYDVQTPPDTFTQVEKQANCDLAFLQVRELKAISEEVDRLKQNSNRIQAVWVRTHGFPKKMVFNMDYRLVMMDISPLTDDEQLLAKHHGIDRIKQAENIIKQIDEALEPEAPIILESCSTAKDLSDGQENIATFIARVAKGRKVFAPSREMLRMDKGISHDEQGFKVRMTAFQNSTFFKKGSLPARISAVWHAFRNHQVDITKEIQF